LDEPALYQAFDHPAHGGWSNLFETRKFANGFFAEEDQDGKGGKLRRADACLGIFRPDEPKQAYRAGMQGVSRGDS